ncbi:hypothetical protein CC80DRAFT_537415 [Byssothecium circinans]|uniref:Rhodopsin domain-containing protein n=1 Tax=Byssothecium circinans TaxID=147558 RepID=A0A6A5TX54_9PLEO|nr:hypothetical protein CC80DRAFT_537415 [Byssothecium circinans]
MTEQQPKPHLIAPPRVTKDTFMGVVWAGTAVATCALAFRYYVRIKYFRRLLPDDYVVGFAWSLLLATSITWQMIVSDLYEVMEVGSGLRMPSLNFADRMIRYSRGQMAVLILFYVGLWSIKANFLVFFYRLGNQITYYRIAFWCITAFTICSFFACIGDIQYGCLTTSFEEIAAYCSVSPELIRYQIITLNLNTGLDVVTDALIMALPISILWNVRISIRQRFALAGVFALVLITMVISIVRVAVVTGEASNNVTNKQVESTWLYIWNFTETFVALLVACLGSFRALFSGHQRTREAHEAAELHRHEERKAADQVQKRALKARAKHFQNSLFEAVRSTDGTALNDTVKVPSISEQSFRGNWSSTITTHEVSMTDSYDMHNMSTLNSHGLVPDEDRV